MKIDADAFWITKRGNSADEYEDAAWPTRTVSDSFVTFRSAVADGATETSFSRLWAKILVAAYRCGYLDRDALPCRLPRLQQRWKHAVSSKPLPWYAEEKLASGAFAALVGVTIHSVQGDSKRWEAVAVGDSCLFHVRGDELLERFPVCTAEEFNSRPLLISSEPRNNTRLPESIRRIEREWEAGDTFYLMSDALACWFLTKWELRADPLELLRPIRTNDEFAAFVGRERDDVHGGIPALKNDDVTLIRCSVSGP